MMPQSHRTSDSEALRDLTTNFSQNTRSTGQQMTSSGVQRESRLQSVSSGPTDAGGKIERSTGSKGSKMSLLANMGKGKGKENNFDVAKLK